MSISEEELRKIAELARLDFTPEKNIYKKNKVSYRYLWSPNTVPSGPCQQ